VLADAELRLRDAASKKILLEVTLLRAIEARNSVSIDSVLKQLNALRGQGGGSVATTAPVGTRSTASPSPSPTPEAKSGTQWNASLPPATQAAPANPPPQVGGYQTTPAVASSAAPTAPVPSENLEELWSQLVEGVKRASRFRAGYLINAHPVSFQKSLFTIGYDPEFADEMGLADNPGTHTLLQTKLAELGHPNSQFKFIKAEAPIGRVPVAAPAAMPVDTAPTPQMPKPPTAAVARSAAPPSEKKASVQFNKDDFKNDPLIQKALEVFKGQIVEVRA
jgi:DNA polymerase-3 subunit gamma/tau